MNKSRFISSASGLIAAVCLLTINAMAGGNDMALKITSSAFSEGDMIPRQHTCDGADASPALSWSGVPEGTKSLALICDDPDAPMGTWVHWVLFNIPPGESGLPAKVPSNASLSNGAKHGTNDFRRLGYGGPCPPGGTHRYYFKLYALDTVLNLDSGATKSKLEEAMRGRILAEGQLMGKYQR
jgi:Raf kinase inhibitor-like YbhB/YbcL family protein